MLALKNLARRKIRTGLTVLGVALGVASVVALVSVSRGMRNQFDDIFATSGTDLVLTRKGAADPFISYLPLELLDEIRAFEGVREAHPFLFGATQVPKHPFLFSFGVTAGSPFLAQLSITEGRGLFDVESPDPDTERDTDPDPDPEEALHGVVLGRRAAEFFEQGVGDVFELVHDQYEIVGIYESLLPMLDAGAMLTFTDAQLETGLEDKLNSVLITIDRADEPDVLRFEESLEAAFTSVEASLPGSFTDTFKEFDMAEQMVTVISILAMLIGGVGVMNTMLMSVFERTREIGVLQAVGWSKAMILRLVLAEATIVCLLAGPVGIVLGLTGVRLISSVGELSWIRGSITPGLFVMALGVGLGMGLVGAAYPAWRAVRITPIEALRYE